MKMFWRNTDRKLGKNKWKFTVSPADVQEAKNSLKLEKEQREQEAADKEKKQKECSHVTQELAINPTSPKTEYFLVCCECGSYTEVDYFLYHKLKGKLGSYGQK